jgi:hypothetical protein
MKHKSIRELDAQRAVLLRQLRRVGPLIEGSLALVPRKCGSPACACARGVTKHQALILCKKVHGRSVATYIPKALQEQVRGWQHEYQRMKRLVKAISAINEQIIRRHVQEQRQARQGRRPLRVVPKN